MDVPLGDVKYTRGSCRNARSCKARAYGVPSRSFFLLLLFHVLRDVLLSVA